MIIDQLPAISAPLQSTDEIPVERGQLIYKVSVGDSFVNKAGDTMTGGLEIDGNDLNIENTAWAVTETPTSNSYSFVNFKDKNGTTFAQVAGSQFANGNVGLRFAARRTVGGTETITNFTLLVDQNGQSVVSVNHPESWLSALGLGTSGALPITIDQGGTGATTWEGAAANLNAIKMWNINSGNAVTTSVKRKISFSGTITGQLVVVGNSAARCGMYIFYGSTSTVVFEPIKAASACTITTGTGFFTITSSSGSLYPYIMTGAPFSRFSESAAT